MAPQPPCALRVSAAHCSAASRRSIGSLRPGRPLGSEPRLPSGPVAHVTWLASLPQHPSRRPWHAGREE